MSKNKDEFVWQYLQHAKLQDIASESRGYFTLWLVLSGVAVVLGLVFDVGAESINIEEPGEWFDLIPNWAWYGIIYAVFSWVARGEEYKFVVPNLGFKSWLFLSAVMVAVFASFEHCAWWVATPFFLGVILFVQLLDSLALKGKSNLEPPAEPEPENF